MKGQDEVWFSGEKNKRKYGTASDVEFGDPGYDLLEDLIIEVKLDTWLDRAKVAAKSCCVSVISDEEVAWTDERSLVPTCSTECPSHFALIVLLFHLVDLGDFLGNDLLGGILGKQVIQNSTVWS